MPPSQNIYNVNWVFSNNSNVHVATHRDWFTSLTSFELTLEDGTKVEGLGDVALPVKLRPKSNSKGRQGTLTLQDVCYVPTATCNILGKPILRDYEVKLDYPDGAIYSARNGAKAGILDSGRLYSLRLTGQSSKQTSFKPNVKYAIGANLLESEWRRWEELKARMAEETEQDDDGKKGKEDEDDEDGEEGTEGNGGDDEKEDGDDEGEEDGDEGVGGTNASDTGESSGSDPEDFEHELEEDPLAHVSDRPLSTGELK